MQPMDPDHSIRLCIACHWRHQRQPVHIWLGEAQEIIPGQGPWPDHKLHWLSWRHDWPRRTRNPNRFLRRKGKALGSMTRHSCIGTTAGKISIQCSSWLLVSLSWKLLQCIRKSLCRRIWQRRPQNFWFEKKLNYFWAKFEEWNLQSWIWLTRHSDEQAGCHLSWGTVSCVWFEDQASCEWILIHELELKQLYIMGCMTQSF